MSTVLGFLLGVGFFLPTPATGQDPEPVVHAVLFYSPTCPHCHALINTHLIPLQQQYGRRLVLLAFDVSQGWASEIYWAALRQYEVPEEDWVVPIMLVNDEILVGGNEIPARLTQILDEGLAGDGVDLPDLPALLTLLEEQGMLDPRYPDRRVVLQAAPEDEATPEEAAQPGEEPTERGDSTPAVPVTPPAGDTAGVPPGAPVPDSQAVAGGAAVADTLAVEAGGRVDPSSPVLEDTGRARESVSGRAGDTSSPEAAPLPGDPAPPSNSGAQPPPEGGTPSPGESERGRPTDLTGAVRDLESMTMTDRFNQDRTGNSLSVLVLLGMLVSVIMKGFPPRASGRPWPLWVVPVLAAVGIGVAAYLSFIEVTHLEAVCGPVGDCNTVNQSEYAFLFGLLPVGVLGVVGYLLILAIWTGGRLAPDALGGRADLALWGAALFGTLFSIYLTFLEPFVIGATCAWCLTSAVIMTLLLWYAAPLAARAWPGSTDAGEGEAPGMGK